MALPRVAYVLLWFPKPSETFIFNEVMHLKERGVPLKVFTLYGESKKDLSPRMASAGHEMIRLGIPYLKGMPRDFLYWRRRDPVTTGRLLRTVPVRRWASFEVGGENIWAFFCGFTLARLFEEEKIEHIHAPWANGPATAAWVASKLTGIPFSFAGKAHDIHPPDGALAEKMRDCVFMRTNNAKNVEHLTEFCPEHADKINLIYNGHTLSNVPEAPVHMKPPYRLTALGRLARTKGYHILLKAAKILCDSGIDLHVTLAGSGTRLAYLKTLSRSLGIKDRVTFPGFIRHDRVSDLFAGTDVFVMPSVIHRSGEKDGIPNVIMEALLHRVPVVASDISGIGEVIVHQETGLLVPQRDPDRLAEALLRMIQDREFALKLAEQGRDRVLRQFDPERNHGKVLELFQTFT